MKLRAGGRRCNRDGERKHTDGPRHRAEGRLRSSRRRFWHLSVASVGAEILSLKFDLDDRRLGVGAAHGHSLAEPLRMFCVSCRVACARSSAPGSDLSVSTICGMERRRCFSHRGLRARRHGGPRSLPDRDHDEPLRARHAGDAARRGDENGRGPRRRARAFAPRFAARGCQLGCQIAAREASTITKCAKRQARPAGFEPATLGSEVRGQVSWATLSDLGGPILLRAGRSWKGVGGCRDPAQNPAHLTLRDGTSTGASRSR